MSAIAFSLSAASSATAQISGIEALKEREQKVKQVVRKTIGATVAIEGANFTSGSGVIVNSDGLIFTAAHVTAAAGQELSVTFPDGRSVKAKSLGANASRDAGMAQITEEGGEWPSVEVADPGDVALGEWCVALGHPGGYDPNRTPPVRLGRVWTISSKGMIGTDCTLVGGDSGGPLFDLDGKLIGIHSSIGGQLSENRHVPMDAYLNDWDDLLGGKLWGSQRTMMGDVDLDRPAMGVRVDEEFRDGVKVVGLSGGSPALQAGIEVGDVIRKVGGRGVSDYEEMVAALERFRTGDKIKVGIERGDDRLELDVQLGRLGGLWNLDPSSGEAESEQDVEAPIGGRPILGIQLVRDADRAEVFEVVPGSAAEEAGILAGDVILKIDQLEIDSAAEMAINIATRKPGDKISMLLKRGDDEKEIEAVLGLAE